MIGAEFPYSRGIGFAMFMRFTSEKYAMAGSFMSGELDGTMALARSAKKILSTLKVANSNGGFSNRSG